MLNGDKIESETGDLTGFRIVKGARLRSDGTRGDSWSDAARIQYSLLIPSSQRIRTHVEPSGHLSQCKQVRR